MTGSHSRGELLNAMTPEARLSVPEVVRDRFRLPCENSVVQVPETTGHVAIQVRVR